MVLIYIQFLFNFHLFPNKKGRLGRQKRGVYLNLERSIRIVTCNKLGRY